MKRPDTETLVALAIAAALMAAVLVCSLISDRNLERLFG